MHNEPNSRLPGEGQTTVQSGEILSSTAQARRRALVKGLGKGGAALATVAPIQSFAAPSLLPGNTICSVSGAMSGVNSQHTGGTGCEGYNPTHYFTQQVNGGGNVKVVAANWPAGLNASSLKVRDIFPSSSNTTPVLDALQVAPQPETAASDLAFWIAAYFNAKVYYKTAPLNFPYTAAEVQAQFGDTANWPKYMTLYRGYLSGKL